MPDDTEADRLRAELKSERKAHLEAEKRIGAERDEALKDCGRYEVHLARSAERHHEAEQRADRLRAALREIKAESNRAEAASCDRDSERFPAIYNLAAAALADEGERDG